jgi:3-deoxy-D-manno-octulosonic acid kinase
VRSPELLAYVVYRAGPLLRRADVATRRVAASRDLAAAIAARPGDDGWVDATGALLRALADAGALHPDLNLKNVLVAPGNDGGLAAWALDVDVVRFEGGAGARARVAERNWARLARSLRKWREQRALPVREDDLARLRRLGAAA